MLVDLFSDNLFAWSTLNLRAKDGRQPSHSASKKVGFLALSRRQRSKLLNNR